jgi:membrane protein CcdC involved in cytochrome C biogenesis
MLLNKDGKSVYMSFAKGEFGLPVTFWVFGVFGIWVWWAFIFRTSGNIIEVLIYVGYVFSVMGALHQATEKYNGHVFIKRLMNVIVVLGVLHVALIPIIEEMLYGSM